MGSTLLSETHGEPITRHVPTMHSFFQEATQKYPDRIALVCMHQPCTFLSSITSTTPASTLPDKYLRWTFSQLSHASHALASSLAASGIRPRMRIVSFLNNGVEWHVMVRATMELNCLLAPFTPKVASNREELRHMLGMIGPAVILVEDGDVAEKLALNAPEAFGKASVKLFSTGGEEENEVPTGWQDLATFAESGAVAGDTVLRSMEIKREMEDVIILFTTSGTTNLPKGCPYTNTTCAGMIASIAQHMEFDRDPDRVTMCHVPTSHLFGGLGYSMAYQCYGLKVVVPAATFDPLSSLKAIQFERATDFPALPALIYAMLANPYFKEVDTSCLKHAHLSSTTILPEVIRMSMEKLGCARASEAYGSTEAGPVLAHRFCDIPPEIPELVTCGINLPGSMIRICDPETGEVVPRGEPGEAHLGGYTIKEYWLGATERGLDEIYDDEHGRWIKTGDQAVMLENGECQIVGRYKDMIIRSGENISPSAIESIILSKFGLVAEVVGAPDEIAGEIPVAVISKRPGQEVDISKMRETLVKELGAAWVPEEIIDIQSLGMNDYPRTATNKVQKHVLRQMVITKRAESEAIPAETDNLERLTRVWTKLLGLSPGTLTPQTSVHGWADSSRFSAVFMRETGILLQLQDLVDHPTLEEQAKLLASRGDSGSQSIADMRPERDGPPGLDDIAHVHGDASRYKKTQELAEETLKPLGLGWKDVEDVIPMHGHQEWYIKYRRPQSNNHRLAFLCNGSSIGAVQRALEATLANHSMLRSMAMHYDSHTAVHLTIRPSERWFSKCIRRLPAVQKTDDLATLFYGDQGLDHACFPGPLTQFSIAYVEEAKCAGFICNMQHSTYDANTLALVFDDFDAMLSDPMTKLKPHVPYKAWADSNFNLRDSPLAKASVKWQVGQLRGISKNPEALFPKQRAPEFFKGDTKGWVDIKTGKLGVPRKVLTENGQGVKGIEGKATLKDIQVLKAKHGVEGSQLVKAAIAVVTTRHTKQRYALFSQGQAGRIWPFILPWQANRMPPAMDVDGPTIQLPLVKVDVDKDETVLEMLNRLQTQQQDINRHAHAPAAQISAALNGSTTDVEVASSDGKIKGSVWLETEGGEGDFMRDAVKRHVFNWLPVSPKFDHKCLHSVQVESRTDLCLQWNCIMLDQTTLMINPTWDDVQLYLEEVEGMLDEILRLSEKFATEENWQKKIEAFV